MSTRSAVQLSDKERTHLKGLLRRGAAPARVQTRARVLLLSDRSRGERRTDEQVAAAVLIAVAAAWNTGWSQRPSGEMELSNRAEIPSDRVSCVSLDRLPTHDTIWDLCIVDAGEHDVG